MDIYDNNTMVIFGVPYGDIQSGDVTTVLAPLQGFLQNRKAVVNGRGSISLMFEGYDDDPRDVYDIPEIRRYAQLLDVKGSVPEFGIHSYLHPSTIAFIDLLHSTSQPLQFPTGRKRGVARLCGGPGTKGPVPSRSPAPNRLGEEQFSAG